MSKKPVNIYNNHKKNALANVNDNEKSILISLYGKEKLVEMFGDQMVKKKKKRGKKKRHLVTIIKI